MNNDDLSIAGGIVNEVNASMNIVITNGNHDIKNTATIIKHIIVNFLSSSCSRFVLLFRCFVSFIFFVFLTAVRV